MRLFAIVMMFTFIDQFMSVTVTKRISIKHNRIDCDSKSWIITIHTKFVSRNIGLKVLIYIAGSHGHCAIASILEVLT